MKVWLIDNSFVTEPFLGGELLGELGNGFEMPPGAEVTSFSQQEIDEMMDQFYKDNGHFPGQ